MTDYADYLDLFLSAPHAAGIYLVGGRKLRIDK